MLTFGATDMAGFKNSFHWFRVDQDDNHVSQYPIVVGLKISPVLGVQCGRSYSPTDLAIHPYNVIQLSYTLSPIVVCSRGPKQLPSHRGFTAGKYDLQRYDTIIMQICGGFITTFLTTIRT